MTFSRQRASRRTNIAPLRTLFALLYLLISGLTASAATLAVTGLKTEGRASPIGVDAQQLRLSWQLTASSREFRDLRQTAYRVLVSSSPEKLQNNNGDVWDSGRVASSSQLDVTIPGAALQSQTVYRWKVMVWDQDGRPSRWSAPALWYSGILQPSDWKAKWIAAAPDGPLVPPTREGVDLPQAPPVPLPLFRRSFAVPKRVVQAVVVVSGLGQYELHINGDNVTATVLNPAWSDYRKRVFYNMFDVTRLLKPGDNVIGAMLGNGMHNVPNTPGRYTKFTGSFGQPKLILQLTIRFSDRTSMTLTTDDRWTTAPGPITFSSIYGGEDYDARRAPTGWDRPGFDARGWKPATEVAGPGGILAAQNVQPIAVAHSFSAVHIVHFTPRTAVYDLGTNFSGWPEVEIRGVRGSRIKLLPGELVDASGHVTQASINAHPGWENSFSYTLRGGRAETWHPQFSYTGFRYVEVTLSPPPGQERSGPLPRVLRLRGSFLHDAISTDGRLAIANPLFSHIHRLINQAILSNMFSVLTDCPTREKLGWLEQTHLAATSIMYNFDVRNLYEKMADDMADSQLEDGLVPGIAPEFVAFVDRSGKSTAFRDSPEWGSASILSPLAAYRFYGDTNLLSRHFSTMQRYVAYLGAKAENHILAYGLGDWYDIGPGEPGVSQLTSKGLTATAIYYQDLLAMAEISRILNNGHATDYASEAAEVKEAFNRTFFHPENGGYDRDSQTANAMPLALDLVPPEYRGEVLQHLIAEIRRHHNHVTAGDIGFHYVVRALTDAGRSDVLAEMLSRTDSPSYGFQLAHGATSLTEAWDSSPTHSQNHFMLGHAEEWFYRGLAGLEIDFARPANERLSIHPTPVPQVKSASATVETVYGTLASSWRRTRGGMLYTFVIPAGQSAQITLRLSAHATVAERNRPIRAASPLQRAARTRNELTCVAGSGTYQFFASDAGNL